METTTVLPLSKPYNFSSFSAKRNWKSKEFRGSIFQTVVLLAVAALIGLAGDWLKLPKLGSKENAMSVTDIICFALAFATTTSFIQAVKQVFDTKHKDALALRTQFMWDVILPAAHTQQDMADWSDMYFLGLLETGESGMWTRVDDDYALNYSYRFTKDGEALVIERELIENKSQVSV